MLILTLIVVILATILFLHVYNERRWERYVFTLRWCGHRSTPWYGRI